METGPEPSLYRHLEHNANAKGRQSLPMASAAAQTDPPAPCFPVNPAVRVLPFVPASHSPVAKLALPWASSLPVAEALLI